MTGTSSIARRRTAGILAFFGVVVSLAVTGALAEDPDEGSPVVRQIVVDWERPGFSAAPPYVGGYRNLEPAGTFGSAFLGKFRQSADLSPHYVLLPNLEYVFLVEGTASDSDAVITTTIPWYAFMDHHDVAAGTLYVAVDDGERTLVPSGWHPGALFFDENGRSIRYAKPLAAVIDVPEGEHELRIGATSLLGPYALLTAGVLAAPSPQAAPAGEAPVEEARPDEAEAPPPGG